MEEGKEKGGNGREKEKKEGKKARREEKRKKGTTLQHVNINGTSAMGRPYSQSPSIHILLLETLVREG